MDTLTGIISELLDGSTRDLSYQEIPDVLQEKFLAVKERLDRGEISYDQLKAEILKHLNDMNTTEEIRPGSMAQLLIGCLEEDGGICKKSEGDFTFIYDNGLQLLDANVSEEGLIVNEDSYAIVYITGPPESISIDGLKKLESMGFKKMKINYKSADSLSYQTLDINNLSKYIYDKPEKIDNSGLLLFCALIVVLLLIMYMKK